VGIRRAIARWFGYGGIEWPHSLISDMPIKIVRRKPGPNYVFLPIDRYPGGVHILPGEIGCDPNYRYLLANENKLRRDS
jgi:hypothetical protein